MIAARPHKPPGEISTRSAPAAAPTIAARVATLDWTAIEACLDRDACAVVPSLLSQNECEVVSALYAADTRFRSRVVMARHNYGSGEYKYFAYPLPRLVGGLRTAFYPPLAAIANRWNAAMGLDIRFPDKHKAFIQRCHAAGQIKPTPLMLQYGAGDYNCLHQDLYGDHVFPLQVAFLLSSPGTDFTGGEFVLTEQRPRMQSRAEVISLRQGDGVIFPVRHRPRASKRGVYRVNVRHGVSRVRAGHRQTLGIIFHDAQ